MEIQFTSPKTAVVIFASKRRFDDGGRTDCTVINRLLLWTSGLSRDCQRFGVTNTFVCDAIATSETPPKCRKSCGKAHR